MPVDNSTATRKRAAPAVLALLILCGCDVQTFDDAVGTIDTPPAPPPSDPPPADPTPDPPDTGLTPVFSSIQANVFTASCAGAACHGGGSPSAELALDAVNSYADLVGIASSQEPAILRVVAGDADNSYLIQKLEGTAASGGVMPPSGGLPQSTIDVVRLWIGNGAVDDRASIKAGVRIRSLDPMPGAVLNEPPRNIVAGFSRELNAASVDSNTFILESSGGDGSFENGAVRIEAASVGVVPGNPSAAVIDLSGVALNDDTYRVRLASDLGLVVEDLDGNALDGDRDGKGGGEYRAEFVLSTADTPAAK